MERYIIKYLMDSTNDEWRKRYYDYMKMALDHHLWSYGNHINSSLERWIDHKQNYVIPKHGIWSFIQSTITKILPTLARPKKEMNYEVNLQKQNYTYRILAIYQKPYFPNETVKALYEIGIGVEFACDEGKIWTDAMSQLYAWFGRMRFAPFNEILNDSHIEELKEIYVNLFEAIKESNMDALVVYTAEPFESKILIDIFRDLGKISIECMHGIPGNSPMEEERVDYVLTYGEQIRDIFLKAGYPKDKVLVSGNSKYLSVPNLSNQIVRCTTEDVLVLTSVTSVPHQHSWKYDEFGINDRSLLITYLYSVESVLKKNGIKHARLRPHPMLDKQWLMNFIDKEFYELDFLSLQESFAKATCCIGQNSTAVLEAIQSGVTYLVYEPGDGIHSMCGGKFTPLFDGSNPYLKVANTEEELDEMIKSHYCPDLRVLNGFMECFKPEVIKEVLDKHCKKQ